MGRNISGLTPSDKSSSSCNGHEAFLQIPEREKSKEPTVCRRCGNELPGPADQKIKTFSNRLCCFVSPSRQTQRPGDICDTTPFDMFQNTLVLICTPHLTSPHRCLNLMQCVAHHHVGKYCLQVPSPVNDPGILPSLPRTWLDFWSILVSNRKSTPSFPPPPNKHATACATGQSQCRALIKTTRMGVLFRWVGRVKPGISLESSVPTKKESNQTNNKQYQRPKLIGYNGFPPSPLGIN